MMISVSTSTAWFGARTIVAVVLLMGVAVLGQQHSDDCRIECYPNTKLINGKGAGSKDNCRWIMRTDGKAARLCDHIKCKKICSASHHDQHETSSLPASDSFRIEQQTEPDSPLASAEGAMRHLHGSKLAKAPVPGVVGGRLAAGASQGSQGQVSRRTAPTLSPSVQYDENDTPPPVSRFLDISPEE